MSTAWRSRASAGGALNASPLSAALLERFGETPADALVALLALALIAVPRDVLHDLGIIQEGIFANSLFVFVPPLVRIAVVLWRRVPAPFPTLLPVGAVYGVLLMLGHQALWNTAWDGVPPALGGNLGGLSPVAQEVVVRGFAAMSGLVTGTLVGAVGGLAARAVGRLLRR